ncbi:hypothetical protein BDB00DRAFT_792970 [Zychaea mexicana]|uniref:uncharacterized protein n=1 Tax=Zychaea mexicana TaxID=64656 RepID=UPI0022FE2CCF|nr:uncharacterized protein BDB00DRAFT_792970 [Zychaea mexicana]KAI9484320.1 hypothetical protein BDB00DRAFT_792970 [Zychaea mexicana]
MGNMNFSSTPNLGSMAFAPQAGGGGGPGANTAGDMSQFDQTDLMGMNPFLGQMTTQQQQQLLAPMPQAANLHNLNQQQVLQQQQQQQQQQHSPAQQQQHGLYSSPQNMGPFPANASNGALQNQLQQQQNRGMFQPGDMMSPNTPQSLLFQQQQQQQQQQQMAMNRVRQSPSQSPALNNAHFQGSPVIGGSPQVGSNRMPNDFAASSPMGTSVSSPVQGQTPSMGGPGTPINRVIPSQMGRYMQHMSAQQQAMMQGNIPSPSGNNRHIPSQASPQQMGQGEGVKDAQVPSQQGNYNPNVMNYAQQSPMQKNAASPAPRRSVTPGSAASTPLQQHRQVETQAQQPPQQHSQSQPQNSVKSESPANPSPASHPANPISKTDTPSPKPSPGIKSETAGSPAPTATGDKENATSTVTISYIPKTRNVETYGGVDLKYFDKFDIKPMMPHFNELGTIDIHALIMSLKSGMKMEVTNALNVLTIITTQHGLGLMYCDDMLDVLLDYMEQDIFGTCTRFVTGDFPDIPTREPIVSEDEQHNLTYAELFDMSLDEMKSLIPNLEDSTSDLWLSLRERCLCIFNIFRNLSFTSDNMEYLAKHERFVPLMARIMDSTRHVAQMEGKDTTGHEAWYIGVRRMDTLDFRKSILIILSNITMILPLRRTDMAGTFIWAKVTVNYENRKIFAKLVAKTSIDALRGIWVELASLIRRDFFFLDGKVVYNLTASQLATLEYTIMGLYSIVAILGEAGDERKLKEALFESDRTVAMTILRLCITLADTGNQHFVVVTKRGMELVRKFICGEQSGRRPGEMDGPVGGDDSDVPHENLVKMAHRMLDMNAVRQMLMMAMLRPTTEAELLRDLSDLVNLIDGNVDTHVA